MFRKSIEKISEVMEWVAIVCFIATVLLVVISASLRPLQVAAPWSDEGACWLYIWTVYLAAALALKRNTHIRIDVVLTKLPARGKAIFLWFLDLLCLPFCIGIIYGVYQMMIASYYMRSPTLEISLLFFYLPLLIGFVMMAIYLMMSLVDFFLAKPAHERES